MYVHVSFDSPIICFVRWCVRAGGEILTDPLRWGSVTGSPLWNSPRIDVSHTQTPHPQLVESLVTTLIDLTALVPFCGRLLQLINFGICFISKPHK